MSDLFNSPVLMVEQPSAELNYRITDPQGAALAYVTQVAGNRPKTGLAGFFALEKDTSRAVVQVARPDGAPLFFVDRAAETPGVWHVPCAVVAPDGQLIGSVGHGSAQVARNMLTSQGNQQLYRLLDARQQPLCRIEWEQVWPVQGASDTRWEGGRFAEFTDMNGTHIAHLDISASDRMRNSFGNTDRFTLQIGFQLPEPLRALVIAAPLAMDLTPGS